MSLEEVGDPFLEIFAGWLLVGVLLASFLGVYIYFSSTDEELDSLLTTVKRGATSIQTRVMSSITSPKKVGKPVIDDPLDDETAASSSNNLHSLASSSLIR